MPINFALFIQWQDPAALMRQATEYAARFPAIKIGSVFVSGVESLQGWENFWQELPLPIDDDAEVTLEINSPDLEPRAVPLINRLSFTGRMESIGKWKKHAANINLDVGYEEAWPDDLLPKLTHISLYEKNGFSEKIYDERRMLLNAEGFAAYDLYHFARPGFESRQQLHYLSCLPYIGLGPEAVSRTEEASLAGKLALALTTPQGADVRTAPHDRLLNLQKEGLIEIDGNRFRPSLQGRFMVTSIVDYLSGSN